MELEFFCKPGTDLEWFEYWRKFCFDFLLSLGLREENLKLRDHDRDELAFYSKATTDIEYKFPFGWGELWGIADRKDYDLSCHISASGKSLEYFDPDDGSKYIPYVIEPSLGAERLLLAFLCDAYDEEALPDGETRRVLRIHPYIAPVKAAVLPLTKKLGDEARELYGRLSKKFNVEYDETGQIGKRYRRQDEIGTPFCVTVDFDTPEDKCVTVRERDSMLQERIELEALAGYLESRLDF